MKTFAWLIRRELWENSGIWRLPAAVGLLMLLAASFGDIDLVAPGALTTPDQPPVGGVLWLFGFGLAIIAVSWVYSSWYLLDCLHGERRDRSVLFWRALPISDAQTVLSKLTIALLIIPGASFLIADGATLGMALAVTLRVSSPAVRFLLWTPQHWWELQVLWMYLIGAMSLWYLPLAGWLLAVSAWARTSAGLWALLPLLVPFLIERWLLHTHMIGSLIAERLTGFVSIAFHNNADEAFSVAALADRSRGVVPLDRTVWELINPLGLLANKATWIGAAIGIVLVAIAVELRRRRVEQ